MSTSNVITYNETRDQIITNSLSLLGVIAAGESPTTADITLCASFLNQMILSWMGQGIHLWTEEEGTLFLVSGQGQYFLQTGVNGAFASDGSGTPVETTLSTSAGSGSQTVQVATSTGMSSGDTIGICQDNQTIFWTTINGTPSGNTVTLTSVTTSTASSGNAVYTYTTQ